MVELEVTAAGGRSLRGDEDGEGPAVVQLHGLTAVRRYVIHGSTALARTGYHSIAYDSRGHGESDPAPPGEGYSYTELADDLGTVLESVARDRRVVLAGHSMGAHTIAAYALRDPEQIAGVVLIGPAALGEPTSEESAAYWRRLSDGLREDGIEGFIAAYDDERLDPDWRETLLRLARGRLELHRDLGAIADALAQTPLSQPFDGIESLEAIELPALVVASHDEADSGHPYATAVAWADHLPQARMISEEPGQSPLAWQGGRLARVIAEFAAEPEVLERLSD